MGQLLQAQQGLAGQGPLLFEPFLQDGPSSLYPLPVKVANKLEAPGSAQDLESVGGLPPAAAAPRRCGLTGARQRLGRVLPAPGAAPGSAWRGPQADAAAPRALHLVAGRPADRRRAPPAPQVGHVRRFFLLDTSLGAKPGGGSQVVQWAAELSLQVAIRADQRSAIYPPVLRVRWGAGQRRGGLVAQDSG
jgi:hypothetical protein